VTGLMLADRIAIIRRGKIIALDTPARLKSQLVGPSLLEVRLAHALDGYLAELTDLIEVEAQGDNWFRYRTSIPERTNPALLARLAGMGAPVLTLSEVTLSLEEVYLRIVAEGQDGE